MYTYLFIFFPSIPIGSSHSVAGRIPACVQGPELDIIVLLSSDGPSSCPTWEKMGLQIWDIYLYIYIKLYLPGDPNSFSCGAASGCVRGMAALRISFSDGGEGNALLRLGSWT